LNDASDSPVQLKFAAERFQITPPPWNGALIVVPSPLREGQKFCNRNVFPSGRRNLGFEKLNVA
jgi:hypothetical protein